MTQVYGLGTDFSIVIIQLDWIIQRSSKWGQISTLNKTIQIMLVHEFRLMLVQCRQADREYRNLAFRLSQINKKS